jgi:hypothetical protein
MGTFGRCLAGVIFCQKCAAEGKISVFNHDKSSARAHAAAAKHEDPGLIPIDIFRSVLAKLVQKMVALDYWPIHTVEHPVMRQYLGEGTLGKSHLNGMIDRLYDLVIGEISVRIAHEEFLGMETDSWSRFGLSMFGLVALGRDAAWLLDVVVPPEPTHSAHLLALVAEDVMDRFGIDTTKIVGWATDCAPVGIACVIDTGLQHDACVGHISATIAKEFGGVIKKMPGAPWKILKKHQASRKNSAKFIQYVDSIVQGAHGADFLRYDDAISPRWRPKRPALSVPQRWLSRFEMCYSIHVFRWVDEQYSRANGLTPLDPLVYEFNDVMLRFFKTMHDGLLRLEQESRSIIFDAIAYLFQMRSRVLKIAGDLEGDEAFLLWEKAWDERYPSPRRTLSFFFSRKPPAYMLVI